jgi:hypothetical protein
MAQQGMRTIIVNPATAVGEPTRAELEGLEVKRAAAAKARAEADRLEREADDALRTASRLAVKEGTVKAFQTKAEAVKMVEEAWKRGEGTMIAVFPRTADGNRHVRSSIESIGDTEFNKNNRKSYRMYFFSVSDSGNKNGAEFRVDPDYPLSELVVTRFFQKSGEAPAPAPSDKPANKTTNPKNIPQGGNEE